MSSGEEGGGKPSRRRSRFRHGRSKQVPAWQKARERRRGRKKGHGQPTDHYPQEIPPAAKPIVEAVVVIASEVEPKPDLPSYDELCAGDPELQRWIRGRDSLTAMISARRHSLRKQSQGKK